MRMRLFLRPILRYAAPQGTVMTRLSAVRLSLALGLAVCVTHPIAQPKEPGDLW
jgi:hypothetical protein